MECFDTETLCMHLDNELDTRRQRDVAAHLSTCQTCADKLRTLQEQDAALRGTLPEPRSTDAKGRACYHAEELSAYASGVLTFQDTELLEHHLHTCDVCLHEVMAIRRTLSLLRREPMRTPPAALVATVQRAFAEVDATSMVETLGTLIIQVATDGLKFVEAMLLPEHVRLAVDKQHIPAAAWRSAQGETEAAALLDIQQTGRDLELHMRVLHEDQETVLLHIQVRKQGQPLARKRVALSVDGRTLYSSLTSATGDVEFPRLAAGNYTVRVPRENVETRLILRSP